MQKISWRRIFVTFHDKSFKPVFGMRTHFVNQFIFIFNYSSKTQKKIPAVL